MVVALGSRGPEAVTSKLERMTAWRDMPAGAGRKAVLGGPM
jgi:hypothetical protein